MRAAAQPPRVEALFRSQDTFAEDLFDDLLDALGFPEAPASSSAEDGRGGPDAVEA
ncbi:hypothetical protein ACIQZN_17065 [Streptomyces sp. NPDC097595]|uniref:hypothetical protein n=1 Tax=Streptomyces sp. NPDC097595 TaxID=3366090 RepID=UPI003829EAC9